MIERSEYEPYGQLLNRPQHDGPGFTGHVQDAQTGLTYMQQRYYDPMIGRFLSVDPVTAYSNPVGAFNRYDYAGNNPYRFTDPDGRTKIESKITRDISSLTNHSSNGLTAPTHQLSNNTGASAASSNAPQSPARAPSEYQSQLPQGMLDAAYNDLHDVNADGYEHGTIGYPDGDGYQSEQMPAKRQGEINWSGRGGAAYLAHTHGNGKFWYDNYFSGHDTNAANTTNLPVFTSNGRGEFRVFLPGMSTGGKIRSGPDSGSSRELMRGQSGGILLCSDCMPTRK